MSQAKKQSSQLEKEALAIVFAVKRFHQYLFGNHFTLYSDHKPLERLLNESAPISQMASSRIQRWALTLSTYQYTIQHRPGQGMSNADALSRLPLPIAPEQVPTPGDVLFVIQRYSEISVVDGCLLLGSRVIIPKEGRELVLKQLHISHPGICRMKGLARSHV